MSHLNGETLARLVDERPTSLEQVHLEDCAQCRAELAAMQRDSAALATLGDIAPPDAAWDALETRLAGEGLLRRRGAHRYAGLLRLAAALALFLTGSLAGFAWRGAMAPATNAPPVNVAQAPATSDREPTSAEPATSEPAVDAASDDGAPTAQDVMPAQRRLAQDAPTQNERVPAAAPGREQAEQPLPRITGPADPSARFASFDDAMPRTAQEAALLVRDAESAYLDALSRYAQLAGSGDDNVDPLARLAALEGIVLTTREALSRAPADPIINGYHMTALAQREATVRQIAASTRNPWF